MTDDLVKRLRSNRPIPTLPHEAADRIEALTALCDMIQKYEKPPVDRKLLCAREAMTEFFIPHADPEGVALRAIELWEEGFGK